MSGFKGTQGPWVAVHNGYFFDIKPDGSCQDLATTHDNQYIGIDKSVEQANANLIAAAPELLEALRDALHAHDKHGEHSEWDFARNAIAKALGQ